MWSDAEMIKKLFLLPMPDDQVSLCDSLDNVCPADNTHQLAILHDRDTLNFAFGKEHGNLANRCLFIDGNNLRTHNIGNTQTFSIDFTNDVTFGDDTNDPSVFVANRDTTTTFLIQQLCS